MEELEYNILGSKIKVKPKAEDRDKASFAVDLVNKEIESLKRQNSKLSDIETAVLVALNLASKINEIDAEYKQSVFSFKAGINEALSYISSIPQDS